MDVSKKIEWVCGHFVMAYNECPECRFTRLQKEKERLKREVRDKERRIEEMYAITTPPDKRCEFLQRKLWSLREELEGMTAKFKAYYATADRFRSERDRAEELLRDTVAYLEEWRAEFFVYANEYFRKKHDYATGEQEAEMLEKSITVYLKEREGK